MNRKLIRTTLADVKAKGRDAVPPRERTGGTTSSRSTGSNNDGSNSTNTQSRGASQQAQPQQSSSSVQVRKRIPPPPETNAENFYYKKQIDAHTLMVIVLQDGEEIEGTIEWYDRAALKVNRKSAPNLLLLKHNIKYMFKADEREMS